VLKLAIDRNYCSFPMMDKDPLFNKLRNHPEFNNIRAEGRMCREYFLANRKRPPESGPDERIIDLSTSLKTKALRVIGL
jgi:hypothetical protein